MNIITSGCSFTDGWREELKKLLPGEKFYHTSSGASGNDIITRSAIYKTLQFCDNNVEPVILIVMFSAIDRVELRIEHDHPIHESCVEMADHDYYLGINPAEFNHVDLNNHLQWMPQNFWVKSGGCGGQGCSNKQLRDHWKLWYKNFHSHEQRYLSLLENILYIQNFVKTLSNVEVVFSTWQNLFMTSETDNVENIIPFGRIPENRNFLMTDIYPGHNYLFREIDFSKWCFIDNNYNSLGEYHVINGYTSPDGGHPSTECYYDWCKNILIPHMKLRNLI